MTARCNRPHDDSNGGQSEAAPRLRSTLPWSRRRFLHQALIAGGVAWNATDPSNRRFHACEPESAASRDVPWLDSAQQPPQHLPVDAPVLPSLLADRAGQAITTVDGW